VDGSVAYHAAGLGIVYDPSEHAQRFFNLHVDDVTAIAFSPDRRTIATGELGPKPTIYIWDAITMTVKYELKGKLTKGIQNLAFSPSGKMLAGVAMDDNHSVAVYNAESGAFVAMTNGDKAVILELASKNDTEFASAGVKHFMTWKVGANL
jgi:microtubule-associated protein-like 6